MLNRYQFEVLLACMSPKVPTQRDIAAKAGISLGSVNKARKELEELGYIGENDVLTPKGKSALAPYRVDNAVILAAGAATRFAPLSFEKPKAMFEVHGEILIDRMIRQLKEAGIEDITVVVGYMKEAFFYLEDEFGVKVVVNPEYATRNNHASLYHARHLLGNSYVLNSDEYYTENIFSSYVFEPYLSACQTNRAKGEYALTWNRKGRITNIRTDCEEGYISRGPSYFDRHFSTNLLGIIEDEYRKPSSANKLWDDFLTEHIDELDIHAHPYEPGIIYEFDYLTDLTAFDRAFFSNVDSHILDNICKTLDCERKDITGVEPVKAGLTNLSTLFCVRGQKYIYRHPGNGTDEIINREAEAFALNVARELGLDDTFLYEEPKEGWKISKFIDGCSELDYENHDQVTRAMQMARALHTSGKTSPWNFDFFQEGDAIATMLREMRYPLPRDFDSLANRVSALAEKMRDYASEPALCHNDFYGPNFLVRGDEMRLIDWEYAAMGDPICDLGNFVAQGSGYDENQTLALLPLYYGRSASPEEERHCLAAVAVVGWYWYVWAMYKEAMGNPVGEWLYIWYKAAKQFADAAEPRYGI